MSRTNVVGKEVLFLLSHDREKVFEVLRFKEEPRSWFVEDSVQRGTCMSFKYLEGGGEILTPA